MVNKKAWMRIIEASIAILVVIGAALIIYSTIKPSEPAKDEPFPIKTILSGIAENTTLREAILAYNTTSSSFSNNLTKESIKDYLKTQIKNVYYNYSIEICEKDSICPSSIPLNPKSVVYADERLIASNLTDFIPKKLKLFIWENSK